MGNIEDWQIQDDIDESMLNIALKSKGKKASGYKRMHEDARGRVIPIAAMENRHIENFINLVLKKMVEIKESALYEVGETQDMFYRELNGVQKMSKKDAINAISALMYKLEPYFTELVIRGNNSYILNISDKLETILGRKRITGTNLLKD